MSNVDDWLARKEEWDELHALNGAIAAALQNTREPRCVCAAFAGTGSLWRFTMQVWIDLEAVSSPLLTGGEFASPAEFTAALVAFGFEWPEDATPEDALSYTESMRAAVDRGFAMRLAMRERMDGERGEEAGFGEWLEVFTFLLAELHFPIDAARRCEVGQAFALCAARRHLQGWKVAGTPYALRDLEGGLAAEVGRDGSSRLGDDEGGLGEPSLPTEDVTRG